MIAVSHVDFVSLPVRDADTARNVLILHRRYAA